MSILESWANRMAQDMITRGNTGNDVWPSPALRLDLTLEAIAPTLFTDLDRAFEVIDPTALAAAWRGPSAPAELMYYFLSNPGDQEQRAVRRRVALRLLESISILRKGDTYCDLGNRVASAIVPSRLYPVSVPQRMLIGRLTAILTLLSEFLYFAYVAFCREYHGPYSSGTNQVIIIKDFADFDVPGWRFAKQIPVRRISIACSYGAQFDYIFDFQGRLSTQATARDIEFAELVIDGDVIECDRAHLEPLIADLERVLACAYSEIMELPPDALLEGLVRSQYWGCRHVFSLAGVAQMREPDPYRVQRIVEEYGRLTRDGDSWVARQSQDWGSLTAPERSRQLAQLLNPSIWEGPAV